MSGVPVAEADNSREEQITVMTQQRNICVHRGMNCRLTVS